MPYVDRSYRPLIMGRRGAVAANHPLAAQAGLLVLQAGGNAFDAAVAVSMTLGVVEPHMSGLGGDGFYHCFQRATGRSVVFNGTGHAPASADVTAYRDGIPEFGPRAVSVPGTVGGIGAMHGALGRRPWASLFETAILYAAEGFGATRAFSYFADKELERLRADALSSRTFLRDGKAPPIGTSIVQPALARTLQMLASEGAEGFYRGALARRVADGFKAAGTHVTLADLAAFEPEAQAPIEITYRGHTVRTSPPNSMGWVLLQELKIAEQFDLAKLEPLSADHVHLLVEIKKRAFTDRERYSTDPRNFEAPIERLLSSGYAADCAAGIDLKRAAAPVATRPGSGTDTTYFSIVDGDGNAVSGIQSINSAFGSGVTAGETGILLNNRMTPWHLEEGHANRLVPGNRVRHTMNTPMVFKDGELWASFGTPGGDNQVQVNFQILTSMIDFRRDPQQAVEAPRWTSLAQGQEANYPHTGTDALSIERGFGRDVLDELARRGHKLAELGDLEAGCSVEIIRRQASNGMLIAGSDPRRDGWALAY